jgi:hypothetical protein
MPSKMSNDVIWFPLGPNTLVDTHDGAVLVIE